MRQDPNIGQAAALHTAAVEGMRMRAADAAAAPDAEAHASGWEAPSPSTASTSGGAHVAGPSSTAASPEGGGVSGAGGGGGGGASASGGSAGLEGQHGGAAGSFSDSSSSSSISSISSISNSSSGDGSSTMTTTLDQHNRPMGSPAAPPPTTTTTTTTTADPTDPTAPTASGDAAHAAMYDPACSMSAASDTGMGAVELTWHRVRGVVGGSRPGTDPHFWVTSTGTSSTALAELRIVLQVMGRGGL